VLDEFVDNNNPEKALQTARGCRHPDAQWLASLFPASADVDVTQARMAQVLLEHQEDPRALYLAASLCPGDEMALTERAAAMGFAPAPTGLSLAGAELRGDHAQMFYWAKKACKHRGDRRAMCQLGFCYERGLGCAKDKVRAIELYREAAELDFSAAQYSLGEVAYGEHEWERYYWWGRAVSHGHHGYRYRTSVFYLLSSFEKGKLCRILHTVAPVIKANLDTATTELFGESLPSEQADCLRRVFELHEAMLARARLAIDCWSMAARQHGVVKDVRVMIAKMAWEEPWR
jgi:hypothetical protein